MFDETSNENENGFQLFEMNVQDFMVTQHCDTKCVNCCNTEDDASYGFQMGRHPGCPRITHQLHAHKILGSMFSPLVVHSQVDHENRVLLMPSVCNWKVRQDVQLACVLHSTNSTPCMCHQSCTNGECENVWCF